MCTNEYLVSTGILLMESAALKCLCCMCLLKMIIMVYCKKPVYFYPVVSFNMANQNKVVVLFLLKLAFLGRHD